MRWILLLVGITVHSLAIGQSTLKIYVANDDARSDMDIIDLNTSALDRYGQSVDSTNMNYYTTTMATQVLRVNKIHLFGPEEELTAGIKGDLVGVGMDVIRAIDSEATASKSTPSSPTVNPEERPIQSNSTKSISVKNESNRSPSVSSKAYRSHQKGKRPKKSRRNKKYKGQCPRFF